MLERRDAKRRRERWLGCGAIVGLPIVVWLVFIALIGALANSCQLSIAPPCERASDPLAAAATAGDLAHTRDRLDRGDAVEGSEGAPRPLRCAIEYAHADIATELIRRGADATRTEDLTLAASSGQVEVVASLLDHGARPNAEVADRLAGSDACVGGSFDLGFRRKTPAEERAVTSEEKVATLGLFLDHGLDPSGRVGQPSTLLWATFSGEKGIASLLVERGAAVDHGGPVDQLQLQGAAAQAQTGECLDGLAYPWHGYAEVRAGREGGTGPAATAASTEGATPTEGSTGTATVPASGLLRTGLRGQVVLPLFPVEYAPNGVANVSPLTAAALTGNTDLATLLLDHGADPNLAAGDLVTPLYCAAVRGDDAMVRLLMAHGAVAAPPTDPRVMTPAEVAVRAGHPATALLIAQLSAPPGS